MRQTLPERTLTSSTAQITLGIGAGCLFTVYTGWQKGHFSQPIGFDGILDAVLALVLFVVGSRAVLKPPAIDLKPESLRLRPSLGRTSTIMWHDVGWIGRISTLGRESVGITLNDGAASVVRGRRLSRMVSGCDTMIGMIYGLDAQTLTEVLTGYWQAASE